MKNKNKMKWKKKNKNNQNKANNYLRLNKSLKTGLVSKSEAIHKIKMNDLKNYKYLII